MNYHEKYGPWALVTGASSGIGAEFARQLGEKGLNLVLVARREERLVKLAEEIKQNSKVEVRTVTVDLLADNFLDKIREATDSLEIGLLVNNAGMLSIGNYLDSPIENDLQMIDLNIKVPAILTHHYAARMIDRKRGGIIFTASMLGFMGTPYAATYAGTKAHEIVKTEGLAYELKPKGVDVLVLNPGLTETEMTSKNDFSAMPMKLMKPAPVAKAAIDALGKKVIVVPGTMNNIMNFMTKHIMSRKMNTNMFGGYMQKAF
ncbi:MAG: short-chain dehydrogenase [Bacteroidetes bacterium]|nr:MAG: short-chain dehydrogenase [Bacteroidota bacterium]